MTDSFNFHLNVQFSSGGNLSVVSLLKFWRYQISMVMMLVPMSAGQATLLAKMLVWSPSLVSDCVHPYSQIAF